MLQRLYVHNFRCLENFELSLKEMSTALIIGKNGSGKSTIANVLELFQKIGRGITRVGKLVELTDFTAERSDVPIRFEVEVLIDAKLYKYLLVLDLPKNFEELRVLEEELVVSGKLIFSRKAGQVKRSLTKSETQFIVDWHFIALPIIHNESENDPIYVLKTWFSRMLILAPIPKLMSGLSSGASIEPNRDCSNFGEWFSGLLNQFPASYTEMAKHFKEIMTDADVIENEIVGKDSKSMVVRFECENKELRVKFENLSDGEKCFFLSALVLASNKHIPSLFCLWDEPDNYLSLTEIGQFVVSLRRSFKTRGQFIATSHNAEVIRKFSTENTLVLYRNSHLEPTLIKYVKDLELNSNFDKKDLDIALILGDLTP